MSATDIHPNAPTLREAAIKGLCLENDENSTVEFQLTEEDRAKNEHIRLAKVLDEALAFERTYPSYAGEVRNYDFSCRRFKIAIPGLDQADDEFKITVYGISVDQGDLQFGKDDFLMMVDVLVQEKAILEHMPELPSFKDLNVSDVLFDANCSLEFTCAVDLKDWVDAKLLFLEKHDRMDEDRYMGVDIYSRDMCIFGNKVTFQYTEDHCDSIELVNVVGVKANVQMQGNEDEFLDLVNLLVKLQENERLERQLLRNVAVLMGLDTRLGQNSLLSQVDEDLLCQIIQKSDADMV